MASRSGGIAAIPAQAMESSKTEMGELQGAGRVFDPSLVVDGQLLARMDGVVIGSRGTGDKVVPQGGRVVVLAAALGQQRELAARRRNKGNRQAVV
jgi:hypothetical protein